MAARSKKKPSDEEGKAATGARTAKAVTRGKNRKRQRKVTPDTEPDQARASTRIGRKKPGGMSAAAAKDTIQSKADAVRSNIITGSSANSEGQETSSVHSQARRTDLTIIEELMAGVQASSAGLEGAHEFLGRCRSTVKEYIKLGNKPTNIQQNTSQSRWIQDTKDLKELNAQAFSLAVRCVETGLLPNANPVLTPPRKGVGTRCATFAPLAWELLEEAIPKDGVITWGFVANEALQSLIALAKTSSPDTDMYAARRTGH